MPGAVGVAVAWVPRAGHDSIGQRGFLEVAVLQGAVALALAGEVFLFCVWGEFADSAIRLRQRPLAMAW